MTAESASVGELSRATAKPGRRQFTLRSAFFFSLLISPLFLALVFIREALTRQMPSFVMFFNVMACTSIYGGIFAARAEIRRLRSFDKPPCRSFLPATRKGALYGALFMLSAMGPLIVVEGFRSFAVFQQIAWLVKYWSPTNLWAFLRGLAVCIGQIAPNFGFLAVLGFFLGAAGGAVAGSIIEFRKGSGLLTRQSDTPHLYYPKTSIDA